MQRRWKWRETSQASRQGGQRPPMQLRGCIGFNRGRGRFNAMQITSTPLIPVNQSLTPQQIAVQQTTWNKRPIGYEQCARCKGWGHWASEMPLLLTGISWWSRNDLHVEEEVVIGKDALVEDVDDGILEMVEIRQSIPP